MKQILTALVITTSFYNSVTAQDAKLIADCTVFYNVTLEDAKANTAISKVLDGATKTVYIKGSKSRSDLATTSFNQTTFYDIKSDSTVILKEAGNARYISYLSNNTRREKNRKFEGVQFTNTNEKKTILGYDCKKVIAKLVDGSSFIVYYTPSFIASNMQFEYQFKDLPGFVLEYEGFMEDNKTKIKYSANKITFTTVPSAKFDLPTGGYRVI